MSKAMTPDECKSIIFKLGLKLGVSPRLIATRLLCPKAKQDMLNGDFPLESLELHVKVWMEAGMPDLVK